MSTSWKEFRKAQRKPSTGESWATGVWRSAQSVMKAATAFESKDKDQEKAAISGSQTVAARGPLFEEAGAERTREEAGEGNTTDGVTGARRMTEEVGGGQTCDGPAGTPKGKKAYVNNTVKPSAKMKDFVANRAETALEELLDHERGPSEGHQCRNCQNVTDTWYRCSDCLVPPVLCKSCLLETHGHNPFHSVQEWHASRRFWLRKPLTSLGVIMKLGHEGLGCHCVTTSPRLMQIVSESGIHEIRMTFCHCRDQKTGARVPDATQLLRIGFWPASWDTPQTAFTLQVLDTFSLLSNQAHVNAYDYIESLRRKTDFVRPGEAKDRYREFLEAYRTFSHITSIKREGKALKDLVYGSLAILCPACPQPDENMDPNWRARKEEERFLDALFYAVDGNFHASLKDKPLDEEDVPLTKGAAYFANEEAFGAYTETLGPLEPEPSTCNQFAAMGLGPHWGRVSGTVGLFCARHQFVLPGGHVDLQKGERFANVDFAVVSGLQHWMELLMHVSAYDINCQYQLHFRERLSGLANVYARLNKMHVISDNFTKLFPWTLAGVGKFHLAGHKASCRFLWSFHFLPGSAMTDGEAAERMWAVLNFLGLRTREMNPGHRHDIINWFYGYLNVKRLHGMSVFLGNKYREAVKHYAQYYDALRNLEASIKDRFGLPKLQEWKDEEAAFKRRVVNLAEHAGLANPYDLEDLSAKTEKAIAAELRSVKDAYGECSGMVGAVEEGMKLQEDKLTLLRDIEKKGDAACGDEELADRQRKLEKKISTWAEKGLLQPSIDQAVKEASGNGQGRQEGGEVIDVREIEAGRHDKAYLIVEGETSGEGLDAVGEKRKRGKEVAATRTKRRRQDVLARDRPDIWKEVRGLHIALPSSYLPVVQERECLKAAVATEVALRKGQAGAALDKLRTHLITSEMATARLKARSKRAEEGRSLETRQTSSILAKNEKIQAAVARYRLAYGGLTSLKQAEDSEFKPLRDEDVKPFVVRTEDQVLGDSRVQPSWIWQSLRLLGEGEVTSNFDKFAEGAIKVHWFRTSATTSRWGEEKGLVPEEMVRAVRSLKRRQHSWLDASARNEESGREGAAAYARKQAYRFERLLEYARDDWKDIPEVRVESINHSIGNKEFRWNAESSEYEVVIEDVD